MLSYSPYDDVWRRPMLAGTYDPAVLDRIRAMGVAPDIAKARLWYEKAKNLGSPEAARRLELLVQQSK